MPQGTYYNIFDEHILDDLEWAFPAHQGFDASNPKAVENLRAAMDRGQGDAAGRDTQLRAHPVGHLLLLSGG